MSTVIKSITVLLYDFHLRMNILLLSLLLLKTCSTFNLRHLRTFSKVLATVIKIFQCSILHFQMYIISLNGECNMLSLNCFYSLFIQTKINKQTKHIKTVVKVHDSL